MVFVRMKRPISSLDFCYSGETETISVQVKILIFLQHVIIVLAFLCMYWTCRGWWQYKKVCFCSREKVFFCGHHHFKFLQECVSICAMVAAYDSGTTRANEMLTVLDAILPLFLKQIVQDKKTEVSAKMAKLS